MSYSYMIHHPTIFPQIHRRPSSGEISLSTAEAQTRHLSVIFLSPISYTVLLLYCVLFLLYPVPYCSIRYYTALHCTVSYCAVVYCTVLYGSVLHCTVLLYSALYYNIVLYFAYSSSSTGGWVQLQ